jgi:hypothetical protein
LSGNPSLIACLSENVAFVNRKIVLGGISFLCQACS